VADRIIIRENVTAIEDYLNAADLGLFTSELESFCLSILEAMTFGCPSVAFQVGGIPEVVESGISGHLVPFGDTAAMARAVEALLADPVRRVAMGTAARERAVAQFSAGRIVGRYVDYYRSKLTNGGGEGS
ncbi:MAG: glycosyltransferase, partial [Oleiharenicola lentus]